MKKPLKAALAELAKEMNKSSGLYITCREADALAAVLYLAGHAKAAVSVLVGHAFGDSPEDMCSSGIHSGLLAAYDETVGAGSKADKTLARLYLNNHWGQA